MIRRGTKKCSGSITIFAALSIMLVAQMLFTLIEGARWIEIGKIAQMNTESVLESMFADYCSPLWEKYHLLGMTAANGDGELSMNNRMAQMRKLTQKNFGNSRENALLGGMSLFHMDIADLDTDTYLLMTDGGGVVFEQAVSAYMKENLAYELAKGIYNNYESIKDSRDQYGDGSDKIDGALDALENAKKESEEPSGKKTKSYASGGNREAFVGKSIRTQGVDNGSICEKDNSDVGNPLTTVAEAQKNGILSMVLPNEAHLSGAAFTTEMRVSKRTLEQGTAEIPKAEDWYDKTLFTQYVCNYMSSYTAPIKDHALQYEMEYLIGGKDNDADNLRVTVDRLLIVREGLNMASLMAMPDKQEQAMALAVTLAGATANPLIIEAVKYGILAAWAYVESVLDVRALLDGDKIAMIKSDASWTSTIENFPTLLSGWSKAKSCDTGGLDYMQYGVSLLLFESGKTLAMRAMDVQEATVRTVDGYNSFCMDHIVCEMKIQVTYEYRPVFTMFVSMLGNDGALRRIIRNARYSYFEGKEDV